MEIKITRALLVASLAAGASIATPAGALAASSHHGRHHRHVTVPIPQHNGGDHDPDNNGGPSDSDGAV